MSQSDFDTALVTAAFRIAGERGWPSVTIAAAAREAGLSLAEARSRFPGRSALLLRFGRMIDRMALDDAAPECTVRERLFDLLMRRYDALQPHRAGVKSLMRALPTDPPHALLLHAATQFSMRWMLQAAGVTAIGLRGQLQAKGLTAIWYWGLRTWERDETEDLTATMATLDSALARADRMASWLHGRGTAPAPAPTEEASPVADFAPDGGSPPPADDTPLGDMPLPGPTV
jgi:AcrR family transcriptional regulator